MVPRAIDINCYRNFVIFLHFKRDFKELSSNLGLLNANTTIPIFMSDPKLNYVIVLGVKLLRLAKAKGK